MAEILKETYQNVKAEKVFLKNAIALFLFFPRHVYFLITVFINGWDFRDDCPEFKLSVSLYLWFPATINLVLSLPNH